MYTQVEAPQVLQTSQAVVPTMSYAMAPQTQIASQVSYAPGAIEVLPAITLPTQVSQIAK